MTRALDFPVFFRETGPPLLSYLRRSGATQALAEDIAQDAFAALVAAGGLRWEAARARPYVYRAATNGYIDACRRRQREVAWDSLLDQADPAMPPNPAGMDAMPAWRELGTRQRQLLWLAYAEEFTHKEIASICGLRERSVRVLLFRAREAFRTRMEKSP